MNVVHIDSGREMGGGQWQVLYLLEGLRQGLLLAPAGSPLFDRARSKGLEVRALSAAAVRSARADLIQAHDARAHTMAAALGRAPVVVSRRVAFPVGRGWLSRWKYSRAAHYIAVSECVKRQLEAAGVADERISVVYDGVPPIETAEGGTQVIAVEKDGELAREAAERAGIEIRVSTDPRRDLAAAAVFVYLSRSEGLGSAALLAMAAGVPVVASRVGGLAEAVEDGVTGLLVENTAEEIAAAIRRLLDDEPLRRRLGAAGRRRVEERFSLEAMVRGTERVYDRVLACWKP